MHGKEIPRSDRDSAGMIADSDRFHAMPHGPARAQAYKDLQAKYPPYVNRAYFGRSANRSVGVTLRDEQGRDRLLPRRAGGVFNDAPGIRGVSGGRR